MNRILLLLSMLLFAHPAASQQTVAVTATPEDVGMSSDRLSRLTAFMDDHVDQGHIAGGLSLVYRRGEVVHVGVHGARDTELGLPMTPDTMFRIYSMSKPITSVAIMMLYEQGHFELSTPVSAVLPEFADVCVYDEGDCAPSTRPMTIEDLLTHTSGLSYGEVLGYRSPVDSMYQAAEILWGAPDLEGFVTDLAALPLRYQPGEQWLYSVSIDVLGRIVELVSGQPFDDYLAEHLFQPLGMIDTGFEVREADEERFAMLYNADGEGQLTPVGEWGGNLAAYQNVTFFSGGGGMISTASDYLRFTRMLLGRGSMDGVQILSPKTVDLMMRNHLDIDYNPGYGFGLGGQVVTDVGELARLGSVGAFSWSGAANTYFFIDPAEDLIAFAWTQLMPYGRYNFHDPFRIAVYQAITD